jgi:hypothetical protein
LVAVFTGLLCWIAWRQLSSTNDQFRIVHQAKMALGREDGTVMDFINDRIVVYLHNFGGSAAQEVIPEFFVFTAPPETCESFHFALPDRLLAPLR